MNFPLKAKRPWRRTCLSACGIKAYLGGSVPQLPRMLPSGCILQVREKDAERAAEILKGAQNKITQRIRDRIVKRANREMLLLVALVIVLTVVFAAYAIFLSVPGVPALTSLIAILSIPLYLSASGDLVSSLMRFFVLFVGFVVDFLFLFHELDSSNAGCRPGASSGWAVSRGGGHLPEHRVRRPAVCGGVAAPGYDRPGGEAASSSRRNTFSALIAATEQFRLP